MNLTAIHYIVGVILLILVSRVVIRVVRYYIKFPIPAFLVRLIDNPLRRKIQPPTEMPARLGIEPGMSVLEVGPGNGTYSLETVRRIGPAGNLVTVDIQFDVIRRVRKRAGSEGLTHLDGIIADVHQLPFGEGVFDAVYMIAVMGEVPKPQKAMHSFYRVLKPSGILGFSEILFDPDYPWVKMLEKWTRQAGFRLKEKVTGLFTYSVQFEREETKHEVSLF